MNLHYAYCAKCDKFELKRKMRPLYTATSSSMPPRILCCFCESCFAALLDDLGVSM